MSITTAVVGAVKAVAAWVASHKVAVDAALAVGEKAIAGVGKLGEKKSDLETKISMLETEIGEIKKEVERQKNVQKISNIVFGILLLVLVVLIFVL